MFRTTTFLLLFSHLVLAEPAPHGPTGRATAESAIKLMFDCRQALVERGFLAKVHDIRPDGSFFAKSHNNEVYLFLKIDGKYGLYTAPANGVTLRSATQVDVPGGGTLLLEQSPFAQEPHVTTVCPGVVPPANSVKLMPKKIVTLDRDSEYILSSLMRELLNSSLGIPTNERNGPVAEYYKHNKMKIREALAICQPAATALGLGTSLSNFIEGGIAKWK